MGERAGRRRVRLACLSVGWMGAAEWIGDCIATSEKIFGRFCHLPLSPPRLQDSEMTSQISCRKKERDKQMRLSVTKGEKRRTMERVLTLSRVPMELLSLSSLYYDGGSILEEICSRTSAYSPEMGLFRPTPFSCWLNFCTPRKTVFLDESGNCMHVL